MFETLGNLEIGFSINLSFSKQLSILSKLQHIFVKISTHFEAGLKRAIAMPLHQA